MDNQKINNQFFYATLSGIVFHTWRQAEEKNSCLVYESHPRQSPALNSVDLGIPAVGNFNIGHKLLL